MKKSTLERLQHIYKVELAEKLVEYLIKTNIKFDELGHPRKMQIVSDLLTERGAKDIVVKETKKATKFTFMAQNKGLKLKKPVKVTVQLTKEKHESK